MGSENVQHTPAAGVTASPHNAALLIDFDNVTMGIRSDLQNQLRKLLSSEVIRGKVAVQRAYADWRRYPQYIVPLSESSIDLIFAPAFGSNKKNATDIRLAIDALELVFTRPEIGTFILLSGDSDFSSLVLKLKEYGKFVIGVGIRESASDLLVQNCDEYYSYSELTGLSKQIESDTLPRDPWELVVEAVDHMENQRDVMRSDRLKQVMQELDPHFDEKDAGYNKFSKFVLESARRGLLRLEKMDNGQYEVALGPDANPSLIESSPSSDVEEAITEKRVRFQGSAEKSALGKSGMVLTDALALLKHTLRDLGAFGDESTQADTARERMVELAEDASDPILDVRRFHRLLRQAHDASVVELVKTEDETYLVKLMPDAVAAVDVGGALVAPEPAESEEAATPKKRSPRKRVPEPEPTVTTETTGISEEAVAPAPKKKRTTKKTSTKKKTTTKKTATVETDAVPLSADVPALDTEPAKPKKSPKKKKTGSTVKELDVSEPVSATEASRAGGMGMRSGSRGVVRRDLIQTTSDDEGQDDRSALRDPGELGSGRRSLRPRRGGRSAPTPDDKNQEDSAKPVAEPSEPRPVAAQQPDTDHADDAEPVGTIEPESGRVEKPRTSSPRKQPARQTPSLERTQASRTKAKPQPKQEPKPRQQPKPESKRGADKPGNEGSGLFKRMGAALHRAVLGDEDE